MYTKEQIAAMDARLSANADGLIARHVKACTPSRSVTGPDYEKIKNPLAGYIVNYLPKFGGDDDADDIHDEDILKDDRTSARANDFTLYSRWCLDVVEGIARLNWYRPSGDQFPLSVKKILTILQRCPQIDKYTICSIYRFQERQARRYVLACKMAIPLLMKMVPESVKKKMDAGLPFINMDSNIVFIGKDVQEVDDVPDVLVWKPLKVQWIARLEEDCKPFTVHNTAEYYESDYIDMHSQASNTYQAISPVSVAKATHDHPMRAKALELISGGLSVAKVARETGVNRKTVSRWKEAA
ncbi:helix-turn-helix domain-containing protein [Pseudomonas asiatica]|uniref:helix-turn-helix domain-containing protein n=1 Tax=Pseudomonas asiatica TaxID=2219225 RepID=UPI0037C522CF